MSKDTYRGCYLAFFESNFLLSKLVRMNTINLLSQPMILYSQNLHSHSFLISDCFPRVVCDIANMEITN
jgi:hypothetical protein